VKRRLVISVCLREGGTVRLPVERGGRARLLDAAAITRELTALIARRGLAEHVRVSDACAGGCSLRGPNVSVTIYPATPPGERPTHVAIGWKTYVTSLARLDFLARVIEDHLETGSARRRGGGPARRRAAR
jgi:hypothetical protein